MQALKIEERTDRTLSAHISDLFCQVDMLLESLDSAAMPVTGSSLRADVASNQRQEQCYRSSQGMSGLESSKSFSKSSIGKFPFSRVPGTISESLLLGSRRRSPGLSDDFS